ncbi:hypothetical protein B0H14DRAFT_3445593 [Mycena olivaceomarginata]|nr:hypothetical protein B0H14DRAFT_3445593 [Mycena olivaceomarginata]
MLLFISSTELVSWLGKTMRRTSSWTAGLCPSHVKSVLGRAPLRSENGEAVPSSDAKVSRSRAARSGANAYGISGKTREFTAAPLADNPPTDSCRPPTCAALRSEIDRGGALLRLDQSRVHPEPAHPVDPHRALRTPAAEHHAARNALAPPPFSFSSHSLPSPHVTPPASPSILVSPRHPKTKSPLAHSAASSWPGGSNNMRCQHLPAQRRRRRLRDPPPETASPSSPSSPSLQPSARPSCAADLVQSLESSLHGTHRTPSLSAPPSGRSSPPALLESLPRLTERRISPAFFDFSDTFYASLLLWTSRPPRPWSLDFLEVRQAGTSCPRESCIATLPDLRLVHTRAYRSLPAPHLDATACRLDSTPLTDPRLTSKTSSPRSPLHSLHPHNKVKPNCARQTPRILAPLPPRIDVSRAYGYRVETGRASMPNRNVTP